MSLTGAQLLTGLSNFMDDDFSSTTTSAGASDGSTLVDTALGRFGDDSLIDWFIRPTGATNPYAIRAVGAFSSGLGTVTLTPVFAAQTASGQAYELHEYDPKRKYAAIDSAIVALTGKIPQVVYDETITLDGVSTEFNIPSTVRKGPIVVQIEEPLAPNTPWNVLTNPRGDSTTGWTVAGAGATAALYAQSNLDNLVPKYDASCMSIAVPLSITTTHRQVVASMTTITAAQAAGRRMTLGFWVYTRTAARVKAEFLDDSGVVVQSAAHQGKGWELLTCTGTVAGNNATTLTAGLTVSSGAVMRVFWNRGWFFLGDQMPSYYTEETTFFPRRDDTTQKLILPRGLTGKRNLRLIGAGPLSLLGTTASTQPTNTVEVDQYAAEVIYAKAAQILIGNELLATPRFTEVLNRIRVSESRGEELARAWANSFGDSQRIRGPYG